MDILNDVLITAAGCSFLAISSVLSADPITTTATTTAAVKPIRTGKVSATKQTIVKAPTDSASDKALTNSVSINSNASTNSTVTSLPPLLPTSGSPVTITSSSTATAEGSESGIPADSTSPVLILFCVVLILVAAALVAKVIAHGKNSRRRFGLDSFRLSANNRSSNHNARLSLGGGPALGIPTSSAGINLGGASAMYTPMPSDGSASLDAPPVAAGATALRDPRLDWERQFFDDDDEEHLATNMEVEPHNSSRLQFNMN